MIDLDELRKLAEAATPGPWERAGRFIETKEWVEGQDGDIVSPEVDCMAYCYGGSARGIGNPSDAEFIAAANPKVVLALIERVRRVEAERDAAVAAVERVRAVAKDWECDEDAKGLHFDLLAALDGAPETEWEYGYTDHGMNPMRGCQDFDTARACAQGMQEKVVRRRPAGPWLPVEGESCGD